MKENRKKDRERNEGKKISFTNLDEAPLTPMTGTSSMTCPTKCSRNKSGLSRGTSN
jgi:hypothetical protein